jgi:hypothetical protein
MLNFKRILTGWFALGLACGATAARADDQNVVSLTCRAMDIQKAITILKTVSDLRIVVDPKVPHKRITLSFKDLPPEDALRTVVSAAGLSYRKVGNAYLVESKKPLAQNVDRARAALEGENVPTSTQFAAPALGGGIVNPNAPPEAAVSLSLQPVPVAPEILAGLERPVDVEVKNGALTQVMDQLGRSSGLKIAADPKMAASLVATLELHGIALKDALEQVAGLTGLQISPRPDGVAFVTPVLSLDAAQTRTRRTPAGARHVEQGQLWTAEWADALTSGISAFTNPNPVKNLRRQPANPDGRPIEFKPRSGALRQVAPAAAAAAPPAIVGKQTVKVQDKKKPAAQASGKPAAKQKPKSPQ